MLTFYFKLIFKLIPIMCSYQIRCRKEDRGEEERDTFPLKSIHLHPYEIKEDRGEGERDTSLLSSTYSEYSTV